MHYEDFDDLIKNHALTEFPNGKFYLVVYDVEYATDACNLCDDAYAFTKLEHAKACAKALANGNMSRRVLEVTKTVAKVPCYDSKTKAPRTHAYAPGKTARVQRMRAKAGR